MGGVADRIAARLLAAHREHRQIVTIGEEAPADAAEAFLVQDAVLRGLQGDVRPAAWKVSPPSPLLGMLASPVPAARCMSSPASLPASRFHMLGIEVEVAFVIARDLPPRAAPYADAEVLAAVGAARVAIELVDTRLADWNEASPLWRLADFQSNGALILGSGRRDWRGIDFSALDAELWIGGQRIALGQAAHPAGDPSRLLPWLANHCIQRCGGLRSGDVVTTGTWTGLQFAEPGDDVRARFPGLGEASLVLAR